LVGFGSNSLGICASLFHGIRPSNLTEWGAFFNGMGLSAQFNAQGVMTAVVCSTTNVARPDYSVTQGEPGAARLVTGTNGPNCYRYRISSFAASSQGFTVSAVP
jgi:hypothetical protein